MSSAHEIPVLHRLRRRIRRLQFLQGLGRGLGSVVLVLLVLYSLDRFLNLPVVPRWLLDLAGIALLLWVVWVYFLAPLRRPLSARALAATLEKSHPELGGLLATWVELPAAPAGTSEALLAAASSQAETASQELSASRAMPSKSSLRWGAVGLLAMLGVSTLALQLPEEAAIFWERRFGGSAVWPRATQLRLLPPQTEGMAGLALTQRSPGRWHGLAAIGSRVVVRIQAEGVVPETVHCEGLPGNPRLRPVGGGEFLLRLPPLRSPWTLNFFGGDDQDGTPELFLQPVQAAIPQDWTVSLEYPTYLNRPAETSDQHEFHLPEYTRMVVRFRSPEASAAEIVALDGRRKALFTDDEGWFQFAAEAVGASEIALVLHKEEGFTDPRAALLRWTTVRDLAPQLAFAWPPRSWSARVGALLPVRITASDDHGLGWVSLRSFAEEGNPLVLTEKQSNAWFELLTVPDDWDVPSRLRLHLMAEDLASPIPHSKERDSPQIQIFDAEGFEQQQRQDLSRLRGDIETLLTRVERISEPNLGSANQPATATRLLRGLQRLEFNFSTLLVERVFAVEETWSERVRQSFVERLKQRVPDPATFAADFQRQMGGGRSAGLADLTRAAGELHRGPALALREALLRDTDPGPAAAALADGLRGMLDALLAWEDFEAAIELLRGVLERQRSLHWRTLEAARE